jgi:hypothetical protein
MARRNNAREGPAVALPDAAKAGRSTPTDAQAASTKRRVKAMTFPSGTSFQRAETVFAGPNTRPIFGAFGGPDK